MKTKLFSNIFFLFLSLVVCSNQIPEKGVPPLNTYFPNEYQKMGKVWDMGSAPNGIIYMAADKGLLGYDGKSWNTFTGSTGFTRSLLIVNDSLIYTGSDLDFGVWKRNDFNTFDYQSLYPFQEDVQQVNEEFWDVHQQGNNILFVSSQNIYVYRNEQLTRIPAPGRIQGSFRVDDRIYFADEENGLYVFEDLALKQVFAYPNGSQYQIVGLYPMDDALGLVTRNSGIYRYADGQLLPVMGTLSDRLQTSKVFSFEMINNDYLAFGTVTGGLFITRYDGEIIHHINRQKGLPGNTVLALHYAPNGKLWVGLDYGVSSIYLTNQVTYFHDYRGDFGTGYTALLKDGDFFLGTNQGLYRARWEELNNDSEFTRFRLVPGTEGQVWTLRNVDNTLLIGHDRGLFALNGNNLEKITTGDGVWTILPYKNLLLTGNYNGISIYDKQQGRWEFRRKMDLIAGSCNQLVLGNDSTLWVNIPNFGIIKAPLDDDLNPVDRAIFEKSLFEGSDPWIFRDNESIQLATSSGLYTYDPDDKIFQEVQDTLSRPRAEGLLTGIYQPWSLNSEYDFFPVYNGFALQYRTEEDHRENFNHRVIFREMEVFNNHDRRLVKPGVNIPNNLNNIRIEYIVPNQDHVIYQIKTNETDSWSTWTTESYIELLNVPYGKKTIQVRARVNGELTEVNTVGFKVEAPWYLSPLAFVGYVLALILIIYLIRTRHKRALRKQKDQLMAKKQEALSIQAEKHKQEILIIEQQRLQKEYDQVKQQLKSKTIELANKAREDEEKNRLLVTLKEKCDSAQKSSAPSKRLWHEMQRLLDSYIKVEDNTFEIQMDELHQEFFRKLKERFPSLSSNDLRLCAYLKIGLNSKEIAEIMNIQPSSSYISRSRLRKKLQLNTDDDLYDFLNAI